MPIVNGYATRRELLDELAPTTGYKADVVDDNVIDELITDASRAIDGACGRWFYAFTDTKEFDLPGNWQNWPAGGTVGRRLWLGLDDLLTVTTLTNGNGETIASTEYNLLPFNLPHKHAIELKAGSTVVWQPSAQGETRGVISMAGTWGYVDRTATDPVSARVIRNTHRACLSIAKSLYQKKYGVGIEGVAQVTAAGVVITPQGIPRDAWQLIEGYVRFDAGYL